jgi:hypothetical protein
VVWADDPALPSGGSLTAFHGTDIESAGKLLRGEPRQIPPGKTIRFMGDEMVIPPVAFEVFNGLRAAGEIFVTPAL